MGVSGLETQSWWTAPGRNNVEEGSMAERVKLFSGKKAFQGPTTLSFHG